VCVCACVRACMCMPKVITMLIMASSNMLELHIWLMTFAIYVR